MSLKTKDVQLTHHNFTSKIPQKSIILACDQLKSPANMGSLLRLSEAFSVQKIIISESIQHSSRLKKTARNTESVTPVTVTDTLENSIVELQQNGYSIVALEITEQSKPIHEFQFNEDHYVLIIGSESMGISPKLLQLADVVLHINMFGENSSMNVTHAASIALHEIRSNE